MYHPRNAVLVTLLAALLSACGGSSSDGPRQDVVISASLGLITGADVTMRTPAGGDITGGTGTLDETGTATLQIPQNTPGPVVVTIQGNANATYFDEQLGMQVMFPSTQQLRAFSPVSRTDIGVTTLTELAAQVADQLGDDITEDEVATVNDSVRMMLAPDVSDILTPPVLVSEDNINSQSLGNDEQSKYALRLAALAFMGSGSSTPALSTLSQLSDDLTDGNIDGQGADGAIENVNYTDFESDFNNAVQMASVTLANSDLLGELAEVTVTGDGNLLQQLVDSGVELPSEVTDLITDGGVIGTGGFDLTVSGAISTAGVEAPFSVTLAGVPAPDPGDTGAVTETINSSVAGLSNVTALTIEVINNTAQQVTFDVTFEAEQAGNTVTVSLRYDYVANGNNQNPDSGGGTDGGDNDSGDGASGGNDGGTDGGTAGGGSGNVCFSGEPTPATIPEFLSAEIRELTFTSFADGAPFADGDTRSFTFSSSGLLFIDNEQVASDPVFCGGNEREALWEDTSAGLVYAASDLQGSFNEVNVFGASDLTFFGQFLPEEAGASGPPSALTDLAGTFETQVIEACTGEPCPNETPVGEIITVIVGDDGTVMFADQVISTETENAAFADNLSSITPRLTIENPGTDEGDLLALEIYVDDGSAVAFELKQFVSCGNGCSQSKEIYVEVTTLPDGVAAFFDSIIAAAPVTMTVVADDPDYFGRVGSIIGLSINAEPICQSFELNAALDRGAVESSRFRPRFAFFGETTGDTYDRRFSRYKVDETTGDQTLSVQTGQLVLRADGTLDYEEGFLDNSGFVVTVRDRTTSDSTEVETACADFQQISGSLTTTVSGSVTIELVDTTSDSVVLNQVLLIEADATSEFSFVVRSGTAFELRAGFSSPTSLSCAFTNATGTVADSDITNVTVACE